MVEPLNQTQSRPAFVGKSFNIHPYWHSVPLLNEQEKNNPFLVLEEFFQCYYVNDVREIMWGWTVAVVSSPNSISEDPHDRNNHIFFYEKMEQLVEACW
jgi:hypothetical protein